MNVLETVNVYRAERRQRAFGQTITKTGTAIALTAALFTASCNSADNEQPESVGDTSAVPTETTKPQAPDTSIAQPGAKVLLEGSGIEQVQQFGADTFSDYSTASGLGPELPKGTEVTVDCLATGPVEAAPSANGKWYHLVGPAEYAGYFAAANTFENGDTSGPLSEQLAIDPSVPACP